MARKKAKANGTGTVYPRKNTGKIVSYLGASVGYGAYPTLCIRLK